MSDRCCNYLLHLPNYAKSYFGTFQHQDNTDANAAKTDVS
eukprot:CAMPEP_0181082264 /NCGR_PEP_ID=MMETSP1071-20121207/3528_1 /TAXON_ID=35127 /ORGANISM="Thalassiosira sp., Strain NH16" /LENGTH=39 /DNA_ID= /DNA_START= /DNA_END= /DNA_ORIENTATION=